MAKIKAAALIDKLWKMKQDIEADEAKLKKKKDKYNLGREKIIESFTKDQIQGMKGKNAKVSISRTVVPQVEDWNVFFKYVVRNKASDMLKKGVATAAYRERLNAGKKIPGVATFTRISLRLSKA